MTRHIERPRTGQRIGPRIEVAGPVDGDLFDGEAIDDEVTGEVVDDEIVDDDGEALPEDLAAELAAVEEAEREAEAQQAAERAGLQASLASAQQALEVERDRARAAVARYRDAVLAAEPDLPPELVQGETLEEVDASLTHARQAVARIRQRLEQEREAAGGFPVGAPARGAAVTAGMSTAEKIAHGLQAREGR